MLRSRRQRPDRITPDAVEASARCGLHLPAPGELAERRQDGLLAFAHEAGHAHAVAPAAMQRAGRMQMAGQDKVRRVRLRMVAGGERADQMRLVDHRDVQRRWRIAGATAMRPLHSDGLAGVSCRPHSTVATSSVMAV